MGQISATRALVNGALCGPTSVTWDASGLITSVSNIQATEAEFDALVAPGFIDLQVNGFGSFNVSSADLVQWSQVDQYLLNSGVTSWCPTLVSSPLKKLDSAIQTINSQMQIRNSSQGIAKASIIGAHLEGPFLGAAIGAHNRQNVVLIDLHWLSELPACVAIMTIGAEQKESVAAIRLLRELGVAVSLGHTRASEQEYLLAKQAGAQMVTHLYNAMSGVHHRDQGVALNVLTDDDMYASIIVDLEHVSARAVQLAFIAKPNRMILVTDSVQSHSSSAPRLSDGTLAGSVLTMDQALRNAVFHCAVPLEHALVSASKHPANVLGLQDRGDIATDMRADLVLLRDDLTVIQTVSNGLLNIACNG
jgi:N-acetylglucosamine-6-phosphate deacetylase